MGIDIIIFKWINGFGTKSDFVDHLAWLITDYDRVVFAVIFALYFVFHRREPARMRMVILFSVVAGLISLVVADELGMMFNRPRPFEVLPIAEAQLLLPQNPDSSFVSEYAAVSVAFPAGMWQAPGHSARWVFTSLSVIIGVSQVFVGFHWPSDILASVVVGILLARAVFRLLPRALLLLSTVKGTLRRLAHHFRQ